MDDPPRNSPANLYVPKGAAPDLVQKADQTDDLVT
jgi:hypothetical protein